MIRLTSFHSLNKYKSFLLLSAFANRSGFCKCAPNGIAKFNFNKKTWEWKPKTICATVAERLGISCFSSKSQEYYRQLQAAVRETYVGKLLNCSAWDALFGCKDRKVGDFIILHECLRFPCRKCDARQKKGWPCDHASSLAWVSYMMHSDFSKGQGWQTIARNQSPCFDKSIYTEGSTLWTAFFSYQKM